jgi:glycine/D-amino acid oxidase-like deaminating enzyme
MDKEMARFDLVIIGAGITGLSIAHALSDLGLSIGLVEAAGHDVSTSARSAGMIAPAVEALSYPDPLTAFKRLRDAAAHWHNQEFLWPEALRTALDEFVPTYWRLPSDQGLSDVLRSFGALTEKIKTVHGSDWVRVTTDTALNPQVVLKALWEECESRGVVTVRSMVKSLNDNCLIFEDDQTIKTKAIVLAGGFVNEALRGAIPILKKLKPIKGHLLRLPMGLFKETGENHKAVWRDPNGYGVSLGDFHCFGASMQPDQHDWDYEAHEIDQLKQRAQRFGISQQSLYEALPQVGVRAAFDDQWPVIAPVEGQDLFICAGLRRNGFVFAPQAAIMVRQWIKGLRLI